MVYALQGRCVLVTGGSRGLGAVIASRFAAEGCNVAVNYVSNQARAEETKKAVEAEAKDGERKVVLVKGDMGLREDCERTIKESIEGLGGLDVIVSNAGWTKPSAFGDLNALNEDEWDKCWAVNCKANMHLLRAALPTFNQNEEGGVMLMTSSVAGANVSGSTMAYSVTKAAGLHLMKCLASTQGPKVRVNAILPGFLPTEWGLAAFPPSRIEQIKEKAALKKVTDVEDTAEAFVSAAKNSSMTGASIQIDSGFGIK